MLDLYIAYQYQIIMILVVSLNICNTYTLNKIINNTFFFAPIFHELI